MGRLEVHGARLSTTGPQRRFHQLAHNLVLSIPGLKPEKINILHKQLGITDLDALETSARDDRLKSIKGLGAAVQRKILDGLKIREHALGARHLHRADELARSAAETLQRAVHAGARRYLWSNSAAFVRGVFPASKRLGRGDRRDPGL